MHGLSWKAALRRVPKGCGELLRLSEVDIRSDMVVSTCWAALGVIGRRQVPDAGLLLHIVTACAESGSGRDLGRCSGCEQDGAGCEW